MKRIPPLFLVIIIALWLPCLLMIVSITGCQTGTTGLLRPLSSDANRTFTNSVVTIGQTAAAVAPPPFGAAIEAAGAGVLALLAAWQGITHSLVKKNEAAIAAVTTPPKA